MTPTPADTWQHWLDSHGAALLLLARQCLPTHQAAEDALQDGFIRFWKSRAQARDPVAYLFTCVRTAALDILRADQRRQKRERAGDPHAANNLARGAPSENDAVLLCPAELEERRRTIEEALAALPAEQREVLVLKIWAELTFAQIAETLAIPPNTAAARYRYALQRLEKTLAREITCE